MQPFSSLKLAGSFVLTGEERFGRIPSVHWSSVQIRLSNTYAPWFKRLFEGNDSPGHSILTSF